VNNSFGLIACSLFLLLALTACGGGSSGDTGGGTPTTAPPSTTKGPGIGSTPGTTSGSPSDGNNPAATGTAHAFAYVTGATGAINPGFTPSVFAYNIDADTGGLDAIRITELDPRSTSGLALAAHPSGKFLYVYAIVYVDGYDSDPTSQIWAFTIDPATGALSMIGVISAGTPMTAGTIGVEPSGRFLYVSGSLSNETRI